MLKKIMLYSAIVIGWIEVAHSQFDTLPAYSAETISQYQDLWSKPQENIPKLLQYFGSNSSTNAYEVVFLADGFLSKKRDPRLESMMLSSYGSADTPQELLVWIRASRQLFRSEKSASYAVNYFLDEYEKLTRKDGPGFLEFARLARLFEAGGSNMAVPDKQTLEILLEKIPTLEKEGNFLLTGLYRYAIKCSPDRGEAVVADGFITSPIEKTKRAIYYWNVLPKGKKEALKAAYLDRYTRWLDYGEIEKQKSPYSSVDPRFLRRFSDFRPEMKDLLCRKIVDTQSQKGLEFFLDCLEELVGEKVELTISHRRNMRIKKVNPYMTKPMLLEKVAPLRPEPAPFVGDLPRIPTPPSPAPSPIPAPEIPVP